MNPHYRLPISWKYLHNKCPGSDRRRNSRSSAMARVAAVAWLASSSLGCAARLPVSHDRAVLAFENASPDVIRLYIRTGDRQVVVARLGPFERRALILRTGLIPPGSGAARLLVLPVGAPAIEWSAAGNPSTIRSEVYPVGDLLSHRWIYSGSRIIADPR